MGWGGGGNKNLSLWAGRAYIYVNGFMWRNAKRRMRSDCEAIVDGALVFL